MHIFTNYTEQNCYVIWKQFSSLQNSVVSNNKLKWVIVIIATNSQRFKTFGSSMPLISKYKKLRRNRYPVSMQHKYNLIKIYC